MVNCMNEFKSRLGKSIESFLMFKHSVGLLYQTGEYYLHNFDKYNSVNGNYDYLDKKTVENWVHQLKEHTHSQYMGYMSYIREFGRYLNSIDNKSYILSDKYKSVRYKANIYLFSNEELHKFFQQIELHKSKTSKIKESLVLPAIFHFLYYFGARCKEACVLERKDVHLDLGYIDIIGSKAYRDRRLFISTESKAFFDKYDSLMNNIIPNRKYFFSDQIDKYYSSNSIPLYFNKIWDLAGLRRETEVKPRAYDLRHHFACENLLKWSSNGENVYAKLPYLMTYMGHSNLESTYYYLHLIPDFFPKYNQISFSSNDLIPEADEYEI